MVRVKIDDNDLKKMIDDTSSVSADVSLVKHHLNILERVSDLNRWFITDVIYNRLSGNLMIRFYDIDQKDKIDEKVDNYLVATVVSCDGMPEGLIVAQENILNLMEVFNKTYQNHSFGLHRILKKDINPSLRLFNAYALANYMLNDESYEAKTGKVFDAMFDLVYRNMSKKIFEIEDVVKKLRDSKITQQQILDEINKTFSKYIGISFSSYDEFLRWYEKFVNPELELFYVDEVREQYEGLGLHEKVWVPKLAGYYTRDFFDIGLEDLRIEYPSGRIEIVVKAGESRHMFKGYLNLLFYNAEEEINPCDLVITNVSYATLSSIFAKKTVLPMILPEAKSFGKIERTSKEEVDVEITLSPEEQIMVNGLFLAEYVRLANDLAFQQKIKNKISSITEELVQEFIKKEDFIKVYQELQTQIPRDLKGIQQSFRKALKEGLGNESSDKEGLSDKSFENERPVLYRSPKLTI